MPGFDDPVKGYKNTSTGLYQDLQGKNIQNLGIGSFGVMGLIEKAFGLDKKDPKYAGLFDKVSYKALMKNPSLYKSFFDRQDKKKQDDLQKKIDAENKQAAIDAAAAVANRAGQIAAQRGADVGVSGGGRGSRRGDADIGNSQRGGFATDDTAGFFARGGRVRYREGGLASMFTRRR